MRVTLSLLLALYATLGCSADWAPDIQAALVAARQDPSWAWREPRVAEIERCRDELDIGISSPRFPKPLQERIDQMLVNAITAALKAPPSDEATAKDSGAAGVGAPAALPPNTKLAKKSAWMRRGIPSDAVSFQVRALAMMHDSWNREHEPPTSTLERTTIPRIESLVAKIDAATARRLEANLNAVAQGRPIPHYTVPMMQSLVQLPWRILNSTQNTNELDQPWSKSRREFAKDQADRWLALAEETLAMETYEAVASLRLMDQESQLENEQILLQPLKKLVLWEENLARRGVLWIPPTISPKRRILFEQCLDELSNLVPIGVIPKSDEETLKLVERLHLAGELSELINSIAGTIPREVRAAELAIRARASGMVNEAQLQEFLARSDAQFDALIQAGRASAATSARLAMLTYKKQILDDEKRHYESQYSLTMNQMEEAINGALQRTEPPRAPGAGGIKTDDPADFKTAP